MAKPAPARPRKAVMCQAWRHWLFDYARKIPHGLRTKATVTYGGAMTPMCTRCLAEAVEFDSSLEATVQAMDGLFEMTGSRLMSPVVVHRIGRGKRIDAKFLAKLVKAKQHAGQTC